jgi:hypothetical protein
MVSGFRIIFKRSLGPEEEWEESDVWSSSVLDHISDSEAGSTHSGDERSIGDVKGNRGDERTPDVDES